MGGWQQLTLTDGVTKDNLTAQERHGRLTELGRIVEGCSNCPLRSGCNRVIFGEGAPDARVVFVGEAPGQSEDETGRPFMGRAGKLLDAIFSSVDIDRRDIYITNIVKCRPPKNRTPRPDEVEACLPHLKEQLKHIRPEFVVCLGALAGQTLIDPGFRVTRDRGKWYQKEDFLLLPTFHPAALLRDPGKKRDVWEDFKSLKGRLTR